MKIVLINGEEMEFSKWLKIYLSLLAQKYWLNIELVWVNIRLVFARLKRIFFSRE